MCNTALYKIGQQLKRKENAPTKYPTTITIKKKLQGTEVNYAPNPLGIINGQNKEPMGPSGIGPNIYIADNGERYTENELRNFYE